MMWIWKLTYKESESSVTVMLWLKKSEVYEIRECLLSEPDAWKKQTSNKRLWRQ